MVSSVTAKAYWSSEAFYHSKGDGTSGEALGSKKENSSYGMIK